MPGLKDLTVMLQQKFKSARNKTWPVIKQRLYEYFLLTRLNKPIGIFLLLWPALWALWIAAGGVPDISILLIFIA